MKTQTILSIALVVCSAVSQADVLYDNIYTSSDQSATRSFTAANSLNTFVGQTFLLSDTGKFSLTSLAVALYNPTSGALSSQNLEVKIYEGANPGAFNTSAEVFGSNVIYSYSGTTNVKSVSGTAVASYGGGIATFTGLTGVTLDATKTYGITVKSLTSGGLVPAITYGAAPYKGTAGGGGWYYDKNSDGILTGTEWGFYPRQVNNQMGFALQGNPVAATPEPCTLALLGFGALVGVRKRRK